MANVFDLDMGLACKLGSIVGHCDEFLGDDGHPFDVAAIKPLLEDRDVQRWLAAMRAAQLAPLPRRPAPKYCKACGAAPGEACKTASTLEVPEDCMERPCS